MFFLFKKKNRDPVRKQQLNCLENEVLLCHHRGLLHRPNLDVQSETKSVFFISPFLFLFLCKTCHPDT